MAAAAHDAYAGFGPLLVHVALFVLTGPTLILLQKYVLDTLYFEFPIAIVTGGTFARWLLVLGLVKSSRIPQSPKTLRALRANP
jgi:hypothetical protein